MSDHASTVPKPRFWRTPLRDLIRGRITGRCDLPWRVQELDLPESVVRRARAIAKKAGLRGIARVDLAVRLCEDAALLIEEGKTPEAVLAILGAPRRRGRAIRKELRRSWGPWGHIRHMMRTVSIASLLVSFVCYVYASARFHLQRPRIARNLAQEMMAAWHSVPESQRAVGVYKQAIAALPRERPEQLPKRWPYCRPEDRSWPMVKAYVEARSAALVKARGAAGMGVLGVTLSDGWDPGWVEPGAKDQYAGVASENPALLTVFLPHVGELRRLSKLCAADAYIAAASGDRNRAIADLDAMLGMARHAGEAPILICRLVQVAAVAMHMECVRTLIGEHPGLFDDAALSHIQASLLKLDRDGVLALDLESEEFTVQDFLQRGYSDDGHGDGRFCAEGIRNWQTMSGGSRQLSPASHFWGPINAYRFASRREYLEEWHTLRHLAEVEAATAVWSRGESAFGRRAEELDRDPTLAFRFRTLTILLPALEKARGAYDQLRVAFTGTLAAIAVERFRLASGRWPDSLADAASSCPAPMLDPFDGQLMKYRVGPDGPVIYSIGADLTDDGGVSPPGGPGLRWSAAQWRPPSKRYLAPKGDCVVWPEVHEPEPLPEDEHQ